MARKVRRDELKEITMELMEKQGYKCPMCGDSLLNALPVNRVVDHDHDTGAIRGVLHRGCNRAEGSVKKALMSFGHAENKLGLIQTAVRLAKYWQENLTNQTGYLYPTHKTPEEKRAAVNKKARARYAKKKEV